MQHHPSAAERVYADLRSRLFGGALAPGRIDIQRLAERLSLSQTPVREALARLAAEQLLEFTPRIGYAVPRIHADGLRDLYVWNGQLAHLALGGVVQPQRLADDDPRTAHWRLYRHTAEGLYAAEVSALFFEIAISQHNTQLSDKLSQSNDRLFAARLSELESMPSAAEQFALLLAAWRTSDFSTLAAKIDAHHEARIACATEIARRASSRQSQKPFP